MMDKSAGAKQDNESAGNIGCMVMFGWVSDAGGKSIPVAHTVELLDWATGGPPQESFKGSMKSPRVGSA